MAQQSQDIADDLKIQGPQKNDENVYDASLEFLAANATNNSKLANSAFDISNFDHSLDYAKNWFKVMGKRFEFWVLLLPLVYWAFIWGYFYKILPTASASISDERNLIPLTTVIIGASYLVGSGAWNYISNWTNNTFCIVLQSLMLLASLAISILIFPKGAAANIVELDTASTYIQPNSVYVIVICALIGLADSGISIVFYTVSGIIFGKGTSLGYAVVNNVFYVFYIVSMFAPSLFDLHTYCYTTGVAVLVMCFSLTVGLRRLI